MLDDIVEGSIKAVIQAILRALFHLFVEGLLFYTGEIILFFITFGYKRPRWDYYAEEKPSRYIIFTEISVWVGFCFWLFVFFIINARVFK